MLKYHQKEIRVNNVLIYLGFLCLVLFHFSCSVLERRKEDKLLAQVFDKKLYTSDVSSFIPESASNEDSILVVQAFVDRWTKEAVMLHEAEKQTSDELNIDALVEAYRSSLIRHHYEQAIIATELDSIVADEELLTFYERNKAQYELETPIVRAYVVKLARSSDKPEGFNNWWESSPRDSASFAKLQAYCTSFAQIYMLNDSTWYDIDDLNKILPTGTLTEDNIRNKKEFTQRDDDYEYFYKRFDIISKKEIAPLGYIEDQAKRFILQQRKQMLLRERRDETYEKELRNSNINIYIDR